MSRAVFTLQADLEALERLGLEVADVLIMATPMVRAPDFLAGPVVICGQRVAVCGFGDLETLLGVQS